MTRRKQSEARFFNKYRKTLKGLENTSHEEAKQNGRCNVLEYPQGSLAMTCICRQRAVHLPGGGGKHPECRNVKGSRPIHALTFHNQDRNWAFCLIETYPQINDQATR
jgi:hypothetical protein